MSPCVAGLDVDRPIRFGDGFRIENAVLRLQRVALREIVADERRVDCAVDDRMGDMHAPGTEFARHALGERPQREFRARKGGEARSAAQARRGAGENDRAAPAPRHRPRNLASHEKAGETGHLPDLAVDARGQIVDRKTHVRADIEDGDLDRPDLTLDVCDERDHLVLVARIDAEGPDFMSRALDLHNQRTELVGMPPHRTGDVAFAREAACDRAARRIAGPDHERRFSFDHGVLPLSFDRRFIVA